MIVDVLGWVALFFVIPATWPQIIKNFKRRSTEGVSLLFIFSLFVAMTLFLLVSLLRPTPVPVIVNFGLSSLGYGVILIQMVWWKRG